MSIHYESPRCLLLQDDVDSKDIVANDIKDVNLL